MFVSCKMFLPVNFSVAKKTNFIYSSMGLWEELLHFVFTTIIDSQKQFTKPSNHHDIYYSNYLAVL